MDSPVQPALSDVSLMTATDAASLPFEVLSKILLLTSPVASIPRQQTTVGSVTDPWSLSQVCSGWRAIVRNEPLLWHNICLSVHPTVTVHDISFPLSEAYANWLCARLNEALHRSRHWPLYIKLTRPLELRTLNDASSPEYFGVFVRRALRTIALACPRIKSFEMPQTASLWAALQTGSEWDIEGRITWSQLEELTVPPCPGKLSRKRFAIGGANALRRINLGSEALNAVFDLPWTGITHLTVQMEPSFSHPIQSTLNVMKKMAANLRHLEVVFRETQGREGIVFVTHSASVRLPHLQTLSIVNPLDMQCRASDLLLKKLSCPKLQELKYTNGNIKPVIEFLTLTSPAPPTPVDMRTLSLISVPMSIEDCCLLESALGHVPSLKHLRMTDHSAEQPILVRLASDAAFLPELASLSLELAPGESEYAMKNEQILKIGELRRNRPALRLDVLGATEGSVV
jgi:hypothetical protein